MILLWATILALLGAACAAKLSVSPEAVAGLADFESEKVRFITYKIDDQNVGHEDIRGPRSSSYADFVETLRKTNPNECRYGLLDYKFVENEQPKKKLLSFLWCAETASKEEVLKYSFEDKTDSAAKYGLEDYVVAHTVADLDEKTLESRIKKYSDLAAQVAEEAKKKASPQ